MKELLWESLDKHKVYGLYHSNALIFKGKARVCKSEFVNGAAG